MDWGAAEYERTARTLETVSARALDVARVQPGTRLLDLGSGTGNAALEAARRGAVVTAVEPSARLLDVARARAAEAGLLLTAKPGEASAIPADDASFDVLVAVFSVIFAPDAELAVSEMLRVVRPGGRVVVTSWLPQGPISQAGAILREAMAALDSSSGSRKAPAWGDPAFARALFEARGASVEISEESLAFAADSPEAWFEEQTRCHPIWKGIHDALANQAGAWDRVRERSLEVLHAGNEQPGRMRVTSRYMIITAVRAS